MPHHSPTRMVFRHLQDDGTSCGRASAQMVISSLTQGPAASPPSTADQALSITVSQATLQAREADPIDNLKTPSWFTHPDELLDLLKHAPELLPAQAKWRVAAHDTPEELLADVVQALKKGMPSVINVNGTDHWTVAVGAQVVMKKLQHLEFLDPMPVGAGSHTYVDSCSVEFDGVTYAAPWTVSTEDFAEIDSVVGSTARPMTMTDYSGKHVGLLHGPKVRKSTLANLVDRLFGQLSEKDVAPPAITIHPEPMDQLARLATHWRVPQVSKLLASEPTAAFRLVNDIDGSSAHYSLMMVQSDQLKYGLIAVINEAGVVRQFRLTSDTRVFRSLVGDPAEPLWWSRRRIPFMSSRYFPFERRVLPGQPVVLRRPFDDFQLDDLPSGEQ